MGTKLRILQVLIAICLPHPTEETLPRGREIGRGKKGVTARLIGKNFSDSPASLTPKRPPTPFGKKTKFQPLDPRFSYIVNRATGIKENN